MTSKAAKFYQKNEDSNRYRNRVEASLDRYLEEEHGNFVLYFSMVDAMGVVGRVDIIC